MDTTLVVHVLPNLLIKDASLVQRVHPHIWGRLLEVGQPRDQALHKACVDLLFVVESLGVAETLWSLNPFPSAGIFISARRSLPTLRDRDSWPLKHARIFLEWRVGITFALLFCALEGQSWRFSSGLAESLCLGPHVLGLAFHFLAGLLALDRLPVVLVGVIGSSAGFEYGPEG